jgi:hypothetical protein
MPLLAGNHCQSSIEDLELHAGLTPTFTGTPCKTIAEPEFIKTILRRLVYFALCSIYMTGGYIILGPPLIFAQS